MILVQREWMVLHYLISVTILVMNLYLVIVLQQVALVISPGSYNGWHHASGKLSILNMTPIPALC